MIGVDVAAGEPELLLPQELLDVEKIAFEIKLEVELEEVESQFGEGAKKANCEELKGGERRLELSGVSDNDPLDRSPTPDAGCWIIG